MVPERSEWRATFAPRSLTPNLLRKTPSQAARERPSAQRQRPPHRPRFVSRRVRNCGDGAFRHERAIYAGLLDRAMIANIAPSLPKRRLRRGEVVVAVKTRPIFSAAPCALKFGLVPSDRPPGSMRFAQGTASRWTQRSEPYETERKHSAKGIGKKRVSLSARLTWINIGYAWRQ